MQDKITKGLIWGDVNISFLIAPLCKMTNNRALHSYMVTLHKYITTIKKTTTNSFGALASKRRHLETLRDILINTPLNDLPPNKEPLDWNTRIKIAVGAAKGLTYLHDVVNPPVIYRDLKSANILLDNDFNPKLSDFGLAKLGPVGDRTHVSTRVMGTYGYCAPDYAMSGKLTVKCDVYSFGVVLLELITGRRVQDFSKKPGEQNLISWARPLLNDRRRFIQLADPLLHGRYPIRAFYQLAVVTSMCLHEKPHLRPTMHDVAVALNHVASQPFVSDNDQKDTSPPPASPPRKAASAPATTIGDGLKG